jgi:hypothetical protein
MASSQVLYSGEKLMGLTKAFSFLNNFLLINLKRIGGVICFINFLIAS